MPEGSEILRGATVIREYEVANSLAERLEKSAAEHRQYLQDLLDRTTKAIYAIGALVVTAAALFGIKTLSDVNDRVTQSATDRVDKYITQDFVRQQVRDRINYYAKGALVTALMVRAGASSSDMPDLRDDDVAILEDVVNQPASESFANSLTVITKYSIRRTEDRTHLATILTKLINNATSNDSAAPAEGQQAAIVHALAALNQRSSVPTFMKLLSAPDISPLVRESAADALAAIAEDDQRPKVVKELIDRAAEFRENGKDPYVAYITAAVHLDKAATRLELERLLKSNDAVQYGTLARVLAVNANRLSTSLAGDPERQRYVNLLADFFASDRVSVLRSELPTFRQSMPQQARAAWLVTNDAGSGSGPLFDSSVLINDLVVDASVLAIQQVERSQRSSLFKRVILPMVEIGTKRYEFEKQLGHIGKAADSLDWQDGIMISSNVEPEKGKQCMLVGFANAERGVSCIALDSRTERQVALDDIDVSSLKWRRGSFTYRTTVGRF